MLLPSWIQFVYITTYFMVTLSDYMSRCALLMLLLLLWYQDKPASWLHTQLKYSSSVPQLNIHMQTHNTNWLYSHPHTYTHTHTQWHTSCALLMASMFFASLRNSWNSSIWSSRLFRSCHTCCRWTLSPLRSDKRSRICDKCMYVEAIYNCVLVIREIQFSKQLVLLQTLYQSQEVPDSSPGCQSYSIIHNVMVSSSHFYIHIQVWYRPAAV